MEDVIELCRSLAEKENNPDILKEALLLRETHSLPLHSEAYRQAHRPAYRVISTEWCDLLLSFNNMQKLHIELIMRCKSRWMIRLKI